MTQQSRVSVREPPIFVETSVTPADESRCRDGTCPEARSVTVAGRRAAWTRKRAVIGGLFAASLVVGALAGSAAAAAQGVGNGHAISDSAHGGHGFGETDSSSTGSGPLSGAGHDRQGTGGHGHGQGHGVRGTVAADPAPSAAGFTLEVPGCSTPQVIAVTSSTTFSEPGVSGGPTGVLPGEHVIVELDPSTSGLTADSVTIVLTRVSGAVASVGSTSFVVTDRQGFDHNIDVSGTTAYSPSGTTLVTLAVGQGVDAFGPVDADHVSLDAVFVHVRPATSREAWQEARRHGHGDHLVIGVVASSPAPSSSGFTADEPDDTTQAIVTDSSTQYVEPGRPTAPTRVAAGERVAVDLVRGTTPATAAKVFILPKQRSGTIVSIGTTSFVIKVRPGFHQTVYVTGTTAYSPSGTSFGSLAVGEHVVAFGSVDVDGSSLDAQFVDVFTAPALGSGDQRAWQGAGSGCPVVPSTEQGSADVPGFPSSGSRPTGRGSGTTGTTGVFGTIGSVDTTDDTVVVTTLAGASVTVVVTATTVYRQAGATGTPTWATVVASVGRRIGVEATVGPGSEITATTVFIGSGHSQGWGQGTGAGNGGGRGSLSGPQGSGGSPIGGQPGGASASHRVGPTGTGGGSGTGASDDRGRGGTGG